MRLGKAGTTGRTRLRRSARACVAGAVLAASGAAVAGAQVTIEEVAEAVGAAPAWQVAFSQRYVPAGFETGASENGTLTLARPASLRFDYAGESPRVFAADGTVARWVDPGAGTCTAVRVDAGTWSRLPLAAFLDPGAARAAFVVAATGRELTLTAREPTPELVSVAVRVGNGSLPDTVTVVDASGNRNEFSLSSWQRRAAPAAELFRPAIAGEAPCVPAEE